MKTTNKRIILFIASLFMVFLCLPGCSTSPTKLSSGVENISQEYYEHKLKSTLDPYYLLLCDKSESECEALISTLKSASHSYAYPTYFIDVEPYLSLINHEDNNEYTLAQSILDYRFFLSKHLITELPTVMYFENGEEIARYEGYSDSSLFTEIDNDVIAQLLDNAKSSFEKWHASPFKENYKYTDSTN